MCKVNAASMQMRWGTHMDWTQEEETTHLQQNDLKKIKSLRYKWESKCCCMPLPTGFTCLSTTTQSDAISSYLFRSVSRHQGSSKKSHAAEPNSWLSTDQAVAEPASSLKENSAKTHPCFHSFHTAGTRQAGRGTNITYHLPGDMVALLIWTHYLKTSTPQHHSSGIFSTHSKLPDSVWEKSNLLQQELESDWTSTALSAPQTALLSLTLNRYIWISSQSHQTF